MSSRPFTARNTSGTCYFCDRDAADDARIVRGQRVLFLTARAVGDAPGRPLNARELRLWRRLGRERKAARKARRFGQTAPDPVAPEWLWDRMVHADCASSNGFPVPGGEAAAQNGTRWRGLADGANVTRPARPANADSWETDAERQAREAREAEREAERQAAREQYEREAEAARVEREARKAREAEDARIASLAAEDAGAARFQRLILDDSDTPADLPDDPDAPDASAERFRLLDLD